MGRGQEKVGKSRKKVGEGTGASMKKLGESVGKSEEGRKTAGKRLGKG